jgi:hypothetical protein
MLKLAHQYFHLHIRGSSQRIRQLELELQKAEVKKQLLAIEIQFEKVRGEETKRLSKKFQDGKDRSQNKTKFFAKNPMTTSLKAHLT